MTIPQFCDRKQATTTKREVLQTVILKSCNECEKHLKCNYELWIFHKIGDYCGFFRYSLRLLSILAMQSPIIELSKMGIYI